MRQRTFSTTGLVLRRSKVGETDRIISLLTQEHGKISCVAKGVRKITSSKRAFLEPGNIVKVFLVKTNSLPLLTQATLDDDCSKMPATLDKFRQLSQVLEIYERLFVEQELDEDVYDRAMLIREYIINSSGSNGQIRSHLDKIIACLGYQSPKDSKYHSISDYISALSDQPMRSFDFLSVK